jgi:hypothetical protein
VVRQIPVIHPIFSAACVSNDKDMRIAIPLALAACLAAAPLAAQPHGLRHSAELGGQTVGDTVEQDVVPVAANGAYSQIRICAWRKPVRLFDATVRFDDGSQHMLRAEPEGAIIPRSGCTNWLRLGGRRTISSVHMIYWAEYFGPTEADIDVYGR